MCGTGQGRRLIMKPDEQDTCGADATEPNDTADQLRALVNDGPAIHVVWRVDKGWPVAFVSDNIKQLGYEPAELLAGNPAWTDITHPSDVARLEAEMADHLEKRVQAFAREYRLLTTSGDIRWIEDRNRFVRSDEGEATHLHGVLLDVTERKVAEASIARQVELGKTLSAISSRFIGVGDIDEAITRSLGDMGRLTTAAGAGIYILASDRTVSRRAHEWQDVDASRAPSCVLEIRASDYPWWMAKGEQKEAVHIRDVSRMPEDAAAERELLTAHGIESFLLLPFHIKGAFAGFILLENVKGSDEWSHEGIVLLRVTTQMIGNVLERKQTENEARQLSDKLRESEERWRSLVESVPDVIMKVACDGTILAINHTVPGYAVDGTISTKIYDYMTREDAATVRQTMADVFHTGQRGTYRTCGPGPAGPLAAWYETHIVPVKTGDAITSTIHICTDVTAQESTEQRLRNANMQLSSVLKDLKEAQEKIIQRERLAALGQMASGIAHDFNNALMPILGFSDLLISTPSLWSDHDKTMRMLENIRGAARDAAGAVRRLQDFYRPPDTTAHADVHVASTIRDIVEVTKPKWQKEMEAKSAPIQLSLEMAELPVFRADESQIREILTNLIFNAADAMPSGGTLTIRARQEGPWVALDVSDTGEGMREDVRRRRCFEPFFSTKGPSGAGLGLSVVHGLVRRHHGSIVVESEPGKGTTFTVRFPTDTGEGPTPAPPPIFPSAGPMRILAIDDEPVALELIRESLESEGHTITTAVSAQQGLAQFRAHSFDMIIVDRAMPDASGDEVAVTVREADPDIPVIMLTGFGELMTEQGEFPEGVDTIVGKPITREELLQAVARVMAGRES